VLTPFILLWTFHYCTWEFNTTSFSYP
jgi:hypothetical protein